MPVTLANFIRTNIFASMNNKKGHNVTRADKLPRQVVADCQYIGATRDAVTLLKSTESGSKYVNLARKTMSATKMTSKLLDGISKVVNIAGKAVNPVLCVASLFRVSSADDKTSAFIKETGAMSTMFLAEGAYKKLFGLKGKPATYVNFPILKKATQKYHAVMKSSKFLSKLPAGRVGNILKGIGFVIVSCAAFEIGAHVGKFVADNTTAKSYQKKHFEELNNNFSIVA